MRFTCDKCKARYSIADDRVRGRVLKIRCSKCGGVITVREPQRPPEDSTRVASVGDLERLRHEAAAGDDAEAVPSGKEPAPTRRPGKDAAAWYAVIRGEQAGPLTLAELARRAKEGLVSARTFVWRDGMGDWKRISDVPDLAGRLGGEAPVPLEKKSVKPPPEPARPARKATPRPEPREPPTDPARIPIGTGGVRSPLGPSQLGPSAQAASPIAALFDDEPADASLEKTQMASVEELRHAAGGARASPAEAAREPMPLEVPIDITSGPVAPIAPFPGGPEPVFDLGPPPLGAPAADPFGVVAKVDSDEVTGPRPGESTAFFIAQAGMHRRNPRWKIALFVSVVLLVPLAVLYGLSQFRVVKIEVTTSVDNTGQPVTSSVFSPEGVSRLRDMLLRKPASQAPEPKKSGGASDRPLVTKATPDAGLTKEMIAAAAALYQSDDRMDVGPRVRQEKVAQVLVDGNIGLDAEEVMDKVRKTQPAFQGCVESELRRNPNVRLGKMDLVATVGPSGIVTRAKIDDRPDISTTSLGTCLMDTARRMVFRRAGEGESTEIHIPLHFSSVQ